MAKKLTVSRDACETVGLSASVHHNVLAQRFLVWLVLLVFFGMIAVLLRYSSTKQSVGSSSLVHSSGLTLSQQPAISCPARRVHCRAVVGRRRSLSPRQELDYESCSGRKSNETLTATNLHPLQGCQALRYCVRGQLPPREQRGLILANMLGAKMIGRTMEVPAEMLKCSTVWM